MITSTYGSITLKLGNQLLYFSSKSSGLSLDFKGAKTLAKCLLLRGILGWSQFWLVLELVAILRE